MLTLPCTDRSSCSSTGRDPQQGDKVKKCDDIYLLTILIDKDDVYEILAQDPLFTKANGLEDFEIDIYI